MKDAYYYKEQLESLKEMFAMSTNHLQRLQSELEEKNKSISQSVDYAEKIQSQMVPSIKTRNCQLKDVFYYLRQRDKIGGDFIYLSENENSIVFGLMDCTGHGIPGALLSMMGFNFINEIVHKNIHWLPNKILEELDKRFHQYFSQNQEAEVLRDGMDGILCSFKKAEKKLHYSMAGRPFWFQQNGAWQKHRPDRNSIGGSRYSSFKSHTLDINDGLEVFLFSDGLSDQFGGENDKKFLTKRILKHLEETSDIDLSKKGKVLAQKIEKWKGNNDQTDDISYLSVEL